MYNTVVRVLVSDLDKISKSELPPEKSQFIKTVVRHVKKQVQFKERGGDYYTDYIPEIHLCQYIT